MKADNRVVDADSLELNLNESSPFYITGPSFGDRRS